MASSITPSGLVGSVFVGGGPAGLAPLVLAAREGKLANLTANGLVVIERGKNLGCGTIGDYVIGSDTLAETFLECLDGGSEPRLTALADHPAAIAVAAFRGGSVPLPLVARFLEVVGGAIAQAVRAAGGWVLTNCEALSSKRLANGNWQIRVRVEGVETDIICRHLVLATGAEQRPEALQTVVVAGMALLPRYADKVILSGVALAHNGAAAIEQKLAHLNSPKVVIIGGSHSALAAANVVLKKCSGIEFDTASIKLLHKRRLRLFYPSAEAAIEQGYCDFDSNDICPISKRLFRLAGFRLEARTLLMQALGIAGSEPEPRLELLLIDNADAQAQARDIIEGADLVITALGYRPKALPIYAQDGRRIALWEESSPDSPRVDRFCRVLDSKQNPIPQVLGIGLAAGFVPYGALGGEPSFRGQTNGIWLWQNGVGSIIVDALLENAQVTREKNFVAA